MDKAISQLESSIERLWAVPEIREFIERFGKKTALFSYKLKNEKTNDIMDKSFTAFIKPSKINSDITLNRPEKHGFVFEQRIYPNPFRFRNKNKHIKNK